MLSSENHSISEAHRESLHSKTLRLSGALNLNSAGDSIGITHFGTRCGKQGHTCAPMPDEASLFQTSGLPWGKRASLDGLEAVLAPGGNPRRNSFLHGAH